MYRIVANSLKKQVGCFNHPSGYPVADKVERQWLWEVAFDIEDQLHKAPMQGAASQFMLQPQYTENPHMHGYIKNMKVTYTATLKCICNDSFTDVLRVVRALWL